MRKYIPKIGDTVFMGAAFVKYVVTKVDEEHKTADVAKVAGSITIHHNVPWSKLIEIDERQKGARTGSEA
jgi:hypothetical protein